MRILAAAIVLAGTAAIAGPTADPLLTQVVESARAAKPFAFERQGVIEQVSGAKRREQHRTERFAGGAWSLVTADGRAPSEHDQAAFAKAVASLPAPGYYRLATFLSGGAVRATDAQGRTIYRIARLPAGSVKASGFDLSDRLAAEATVEQANGRPYISRVRIFLPAPTRIMMVAKMDRFEAVSEYALGPGGAPVLTRQTTETAGYNPMQGDGQVRQSWTYRTL